MSDIDLAKKLLSGLPPFWDGKESILKLKEVDYNWRQMEWWGFYFEYLCRNALTPYFEIPGERFASVSFDAKRSFNWDFKAKAIKSDDHRAILNDCEAMQASIKKYGQHGLILALCDVEYNDNNRSFQKWHEDLKGGKSKYEMERIKRTSVSRYRKVKAELAEIVLVTITVDSLDSFATYKQGRNSNGKPRPEKYMIDLEYIQDFEHEIISF